MKHRVAVGSIFTECNHWCGVPLTLADFARNELRRGEEVLAATTGTVGGVLHVLRERNCDVVPLIVASTCPGGPVAAECYSQLKTELLDRLRAALPVSGVMLPLHGSATAENADDLEGDLIASVRQIVGEKTPIVATLDLHAHVTAAMVEHADALIAWETYPHRDAFTTGQRGARMLADMLDGKIRPTMALAKVPAVTSAIYGGTEGTGPFADCMRFAKSHEGKNGVLSTSVFLVHPYLDLPDMGGGGIVITDNDLPAAVALADEIARRYWSYRYDLEPKTYSPVEAIRQGSQIAEGPVLLVECADCCGGGAAGDSVASLKALIAQHVTEPCLVPVVDAAAAKACHAAGIGKTVSLELGHHVDPRWGKPLQVTGTVAKLSDGVFRYTGGIWDGQHGNMGPTAVLRIGSIEVMIASHATYDWNDEQFQSVDLDARRAKFVVVKNPMNYRMAYDYAQGVFILDTPGPTPATMKHAKFTRLSRPYFPADDDIPDLATRVYRSANRF